MKSRLVFASQRLYWYVHLQLATTTAAYSLLDRSAPAWTTNLLDLYVGTIDAFSKYPNILAYNVGNEVVISANATAAAAFIKAAARDVKAYLSVPLIIMHCNTTHRPQKVEKLQRPGRICCHRRGC